MTADYDFQLINLQEDINRDATDINQNILTISNYFIVITMILSFIGLYVQITLSTLHRAKEIAVRRTFGSTVLRIIWHIGNKYFLLLIIGSLFGLTGGHIFINSLLNNIWAYYTDIPLYLYLLPLIVILTVSIPILLISIQNNVSRQPSDVLRYE